MSAITGNTPFNRARLLLAKDKVIDLSTDTLKISAVTVAPTLTGTGATTLAGGLTKAANVADVSLNTLTLALAQNDSTNRAELKTSTTSIDIPATGASGTILGFVLWDDTVASPADPCLSYMALDAGVALANGDKFTLTMPANGWLNI